MLSLRRALVRGVVAPALSRPSIRAAAFHFVSQLGIHYRKSPAVREGEPRLRHGPRAGDRLPDPRIQHQTMTHLQQALRSPHLHLLLCGALPAWDAGRLSGLRDRFPGLLVVSHLTRDASAQALVDRTGEAFALLGVEDAAQYLVRPDGHVAFRCGGRDLTGVAGYLDEWFK